MWEALASAVKVFAEKHLIPSVISVAASICVILALQDDNWMIEKIGRWWVGVLVFCLAFILVQLVIVIQKAIKKRRQTEKNQCFYQNQDIKRETEALERLWSMVDELSPSEKALLHQFIDSGNAPYIETTTTFYPSGHLLNSEMVVSTVVGTTHEPINWSGKGVPILSHFDRATKQYKLTEYYYQIFKYSKEKYGRISHFE